MPGGTGLIEIPTLKRGEAGLRAGTHLCVSEEIFVSCAAVKPLALWCEGLGTWFHVWLLASSYCHHPIRYTQLQALWSCSSITSG